LRETPSASPSSRSLEPFNGGYGDAGPPQSK
jgi:hypothetical protein